MILSKLGKAMKAKLVLWILAGCLLLPSVAARTPPASVSRLQIANLEAQVATKEKLVEQSWAELRRLNGVLIEKGLAVLEVPQAIPEELAAMEKVDSLMGQSFELETLGRQRMEVLRNLRSLYTEIRFLRREARRYREEWRESSQLEGWWTLILMPEDLRGEVYFIQDGTTITGEYSLVSGLKGNFQGSLINGQLLVERIDSLYGKMGRLEGELNSSGRRIQGTWYSYDVMSGKPLVGPFVMVREVEDLEQ